MGYGYKIIRTYKFLLKLSEHHAEFHPSKFHNCSISAIEIATRIHKFNEVKCLETLRSIKTGMSATEVAATYKLSKEISPDKNDARNNTRLNRNDAIKKAIRYIKLNSMEIFRCNSDNLRVLEISGKLQTTGTNVSFFVESFHNHKRTITGFDFANVSSNASNWYSMRAKMCFNATFFSKYWIILQCGPAELLRVLADLQALGLENTGIIQSTQADLKIIMSPKGNPVPDRRHLFLTL